ncbi:MAG: FAD:protein FMN transferase [Myxococcota bacterium]
MLMSSPVIVQVVASDPVQARKAMQAAYSEIGRVVALVNEWKPGTQISRVNAGAGKEPVPVDAEVVGLLKVARDVSERSVGRFDITVGALWGAWDFSWAEPRIPAARELERRVALIDYRKVELDEESGTVRLGAPGMLVSLGGIAKGYAVDRASAVLREQGFPNHLVSAGGDLYAAGRKPDGPWIAGIRHPRRPETHATLELEDEGVATSGDYERFFVRDGLRYHHILDPRTGHPARLASSSTVVAKSAALADAFATATFVAGVEQGADLAGSISGIEALIFDPAGEHHVATPGLESRLRRVESGPADTAFPVGKPPQPVTP